jgi:hypothetical protein
MIVFTCIMICVIILAVYLSTSSNRTNDDEKIARSLGMSLRNYKIYEGIFEEQMQCLDKGCKIPDRLNEIPNMNEWKRYGDYRLKKQHEDMMSELDKLRKKSVKSNNL